MEIRQLLNELNPGTINTIKAIFSPANRVHFIHRILSEMILSDEIELIDKLFSGIEFKKFLRNNKKISHDRFEFKFGLIVKDYLDHENIDVTENICIGFNSEEFISSERLFFKVPVDRELFKIFAVGSLKLLKASLPLYSDFTQLYKTAEFTSFRSRYKNFNYFDLLHDGLISIMLGSKNIETVIDAAYRLSSLAIVRILSLALNAGEMEFFYSESILAFSKPEYHYYYDYIEEFERRYPGSHPELLDDENNIYEDSIIARRYYRRVMRCMDFIKADHMLDSRDFQLFLKSYGSFNDDFENFIFELVMGLAPDKSARIIKIMNEDAFLEIRQYFQNDRTIIQMLIKNIVTIISEEQLDNIKIDISISDILLKLFLHLKVEKGFIRRRARFYKNLKTEFRSTILENEFIRILMFEYIFIATGIVSNKIPVKMTYVIDAKHKMMIDYFNRENLPPKLEHCYDYNKLDRELAKEFFNIMREDLYSKFMNIANAYHHIDMAFGIGKTIDQNKEFIQIAEQFDIHSYLDEIIKSLNSIQPEHFNNYYNSLIAIFYNDPLRSYEAVKPDFWCRIYLDQAMKYISELTIPLVGNVNIKISENLAAYTNGKEIYLPEYVSHFPDPRNDLHNNRNITIFAGLALHEAAHILAGSFHFNLLSILLKKEKPELYKNIWNWIEDFRIERYVINLGIHPQTEEILNFLNTYGDSNFFKNEIPPATFFISYILMTAYPRNDFTSRPSYIKKLDTLFSRKLFTGRFKKMEDMTEYFINRLLTMKLENPLSSYKLTEELYDILQYWPDPYMQHYPKLLNNQDNDHSSKVTESTPLTEEQLKEFYRQCNENPDKFFGENDFQKGSTSKAKNHIADEMLNAVDYESKGTIDHSTRTLVDEEAAQQRLKNKPPETDNNKTTKKKNKSKKKKKVKGEKNKKSQEQRVFSLDPTTDSKTIISEIQEYPISDINKDFMEYFKNWEYLSHIVYKMLADILPAVDDHHEYSNFEGEINIDLLIEFLSNKNRGLEIPEFLDIYREGSRSLEVFIGLDISGSTAVFIDSESMDDFPESIIDIEKSFAIIFGRALQLITPDVTIAAFDSITSTNVYLPTKVEAVSSLKAGNGNRDGDFIRYSTNKLKESNAEVKYFFMISDGQPNSVNYDGSEALNDTLLAMRECVSENIILIYFNCDISKGEYFDAFKKEASYARYFQSPKDLMPAIPEFISIISKSIL